MNNRSFPACALFPILMAASLSTAADTLNYEYDALGRLKEVRYPDGSVVSYLHDASGNRTEVSTRTPP